MLIRSTDFVDNTVIRQLASGSEAVFFYQRNSAAARSSGYNLGHAYGHADEHMHGGSPCGGTEPACGSSYGQCLGNGEDQSFYWE